MSRDGFFRWAMKQGRPELVDWGLSAFPEQLIPSTMIGICKKGWYDLVLKVMDMGYYCDEAIWYAVESNPKLLETLEIRGKKLSPSVVERTCHGRHVFTKKFIPFFPSPFTLKTIPCWSNVEMLVDAGFYLPEDVCWRIACRKYDTGKSKYIRWIHQRGLCQEPKRPLPYPKTIQLPDSFVWALKPYGEHPSLEDPEHNSI